MVSPSYLLTKHDTRPHSPKIFLDQTIVPALVNAAGDLEGMLERIAVRAKAAPIAAVATAFGLGVLLSIALVRRP
jgi:hypothetical protein